MHLRCLSCRGFKNKHKRITVSPPGDIFTPQTHRCCSYHFLLYLLRHITVTPVIIILLTWVFLITLYPLAMARSLLLEFLFFFPVSFCSRLHSFPWTSTSWLQCSFFFFLFTHTDFITMLPWTRGGSHNPHMIYSRGRNHCFHFLMLCIYIFSILEDSVRKKELCTV